MINYEYLVHKGVHTPHIQALYGWSFSDFRVPYHAWRSHKNHLVMALCIIAIFIDTVLLQQVLAIACLFPVAIFHAVHFPYATTLLNCMETLAIGAVVASVLLGFLVSLEEETSRFRTFFVVCSSCAHAFLFFVVVLCAVKEKLSKDLKRATAAQLDEMIREMYHKGHEANTKRMQDHLRDRHSHLYADDDGSCCERLCGLFSAHAVAEDFLKTPSDDQGRKG